MGAKRSTRKVEDGKYLFLAVPLAFVALVTEFALKGSTVALVLAALFWVPCGAAALGALYLYAAHQLSRRIVSFDAGVITVKRPYFGTTSIALSDITDILSLERGALEVRSATTTIRLSSRELSSLALLDVLRPLPSFREDALVVEDGRVVFAPAVSLWAKAPPAGGIYRRVRTAPSTRAQPATEEPRVYPDVDDEEDKESRGDRARVV